MKLFARCFLAIVTLMVVYYCVVASIQQGFPAAYLFIVGTIFIVWCAWKLCKGVE